MKLWTKQVEAIEFAVDRPAVMLAMDMGTGKSRVTIELLKKWTSDERILIVCPKTVVTVWPSEFLKHAAGSQFSVLTPKGATTARIKEISEFMVKNRGRRVVVLNYDVIWRKALLNLLRSISWDVVILDESHRAKSAGSKTSLACFMLGKKARHRLCLSGTPMSNSPLDIYGQYRFLDQSIFGTRYDEFLYRYAVLAGPDRKFVVGVKNREELGTKFNSIAFQCKKSDMLDQLKLHEEPEVTFRMDSLNRSAQKVYDSLHQDFVAEWKTGVITAGNVLTKVLRLQQITSGFGVVETEDKQSLIEEIDTTKPAMLWELKEDLPQDEPLVVFYRFKFDAQQIQRVFTDRPAFELSARVNQIEGWKRSSNGVLAVQYQAGSVGIDLTHACYGIYYSETLSLYEYTQSQARLYRPGQTKPVTFIHLLIDGSIDMQIYRSLELKQDLITSVLQNGLQ